MKQFLFLLSLLPLTATAQSMIAWAEFGYDMQPDAIYIECTDCTYWIHTEDPEGRLIVLAHDSTPFTTASYTLLPHWVGRAYVTVIANGRKDKRIEYCYPQDIPWREPKGLRDTAPDTSDTTGPR